MSLGMVAQVLSALFVLLSGVGALLVTAGQAMPALGWLVGITGLLGGLAWLAVTLTAKKK